MEKYPDIPRPGDKDFKSFPKVIAEDAVHYSIHVIPVTPAISPSVIRSRLLRIQKASVDLTKKLLSDYIWQRESFSLQLVRERCAPGRYLISTGKHPLATQSQMSGLLSSCCLRLAENMKMPGSAFMMQMASSYSSKPPMYCQSG